MEENLARRLRMVEDRQQIEELRATYCFLVDDGRFDELVESCFTEDASCDFRAVRGGGRWRLSRRDATSSANSSRSLCQACCTTCVT